MTFYKVEKKILLAEAAAFCYMTYGKNKKIALLALTKSTTLALTVNPKPHSKSNPNPNVTLKNKQE